MGLLDKVFIGLGMLLVILIVGFILLCKFGGGSFTMVNTQTGEKKTLLGKPDDDD